MIKLDPSVRLLASKADRYLNDVQDRNVFGFVPLLAPGTGRNHDVLWLQEPPHDIQHGGLPDVG